MERQDFSTSFTVAHSPKEVFDAINNVRGWWSEEIEGGTNNTGDEFTYHFEDVHRCKIRVMELIPGKKVVWQVLDNYFNFTKDKSEWKDTKIVFDITTKNGKTEVRFTHVGLVPEYECFDVCSTAWSGYLADSLKKLIISGKGLPNPKEGK